MEVKVSYSNSPPAGGPTYNGNPAYNNAPANYPPPVEAARPSGCFERNQKNKPQSNSAGAATLIFVSGGMNIAWSVGPMPLAYIITTHLKICWFIAAILGALFGAVLCDRLQKKLFYLFSAVLVVIGGIIFVSADGNYNAIVAARYLDGFANGLILVPTLVMAGEEVVKNMRGMLASTIEVSSFAIGIFLQLTFSALWATWWYSSFTAIQMHGCLSIVYGILSFIFTFFFVIESPIFFLVRDQEVQAIDSLRRLQRPRIVTTETYEQLEEHKRYIAINKEMSVGQSAIAGLPALLKMSIYRGLLAISYSSLLNLGFLVAVVRSQFGIAYWTFIIYGLLRWLGVFITSLMMDAAGRKKPMLFGAFISAGMAIAVGIIFVDTPIYPEGYSIVMYLLFVFQLFAGVFFTASSAYLSEAFPLAIKPYYIAFAFIIEMLVHIIISSITTAGIGPFFCTVGSLMAAFFIFGLLCMPETKHLTLRKCQERFRGFRS